MFNFLRMGAAFKISVFSYRFIWENKKLLLLPLLEAILVIPLYAICYNNFSNYGYDDPSVAEPTLFILIITLTSMFLIPFLSIFFEIVSILLIYSYNSPEDEPSVLQSLWIGLTKTPQIFIWTIIHFTFNIFIKFLDSTARKVRIPLVAWIINTSWEVAIYFVTPVMCFNNSLNPLTLINESASIMKTALGTHRQCNKMLSIKFLTVLFCVPFIILFMMSSNIHDLEVKQIALDCY